MLGANIRAARLKRNLPMSLLAERAFTSRSTLEGVEKGDPAVSMGIYAAVLNGLGLVDGLSQVADISQDKVGQMLAEENLPKRACIRRPPKES